MSLGRSLPAVTGLRAQVAAVGAGALLGAATVAVASRSAQRLPGSVRAPWERTNHAGRPVTLLEGPVVVLGAVTASLASPPAGAAALAAGLLGALDDLAGDARARGLRGHLGSLRRGHVTTGAVKVLGLGVTGLVAAHRLQLRPSWPRTLVGAGLVAGTANLINLFDLRPGRALKVTLLLAAPMCPAGGLPAGVLVGTVLAAAGPDLQGRAMLGDTGANALGALAGAVLVRSARSRVQVSALVGLVALTLASERISFTRVIEASPTLRRLDEWGRAPR